MIAPATHTDRPGSSSDLPVVVEGLSKKYCRGLRRSLYYGIRDICSELVGSDRHSSLLREGEFWALRGVSFELSRGRCVGVVGKNGSGKTTLLKLISGLIKPDEGSITVRGRVAPLIALGAGFNPLLTGRENIGINLALLGLSRREIEARTDSVIDFAEISDALDAPVRTYSSGMLARLGFACAVNTHADLVLVDETLAVGDMRFRMKCYRKLGEMKANGTTFFLVSHNTQVLHALCDQALYFSSGTLRMAGEPREVLRKYEEEVASESRERPRDDSKEARRFADSPVRISSVLLRDERGSPAEVLSTGVPGSICVTVDAGVPIDAVGVLVVIRDFGEEESLVTIDGHAGGRVFPIPAGSSELRYTMNPLYLADGLYSAKILVRREKFEMLDMKESFVFKVVDSRSELRERGKFVQPGEWSLSTP